MFKRFCNSNCKYIFTSTMQNKKLRLTIIFHWSKKINKFKHFCKPSVNYISYIDYFFQVKINLIQTEIIFLFCFLIKIIIRDITNVFLVQGIFPNRRFFILLQLNANIFVFFNLVCFERRFSGFLSKNNTFDTIFL